MRKEEHGANEPNALKNARETNEANKSKTSRAESNPSREEIEQHNRSHVNRRSLLKRSGHGLCGEDTLMRKHEPSSPDGWLRARGLSRRMAK